MPDNQVGERIPFPAHKPTPGVCRVCQCTELDACLTGCSWVEPDLCDTCAQLCADLIDTVIIYLDAAGPAAARESRMALFAGELPQYTAEQVATFVAQPVQRALGEVMRQIVKGAAGDDPTGPLIVGPGSFRV